MVGGIGGDDTLVDTKLYYFNEDVKKYELCGSGYMSLPNDYYVFKIDHCSSYVMSEEALPDEFVIASKTEDKEDKEDTNKGETNKEESKQEDQTTAGGKIPYAGGTTVIAISMVLIAILGTVAYIKNKELKGI